MTVFTSIYKQFTNYKLLKLNLSLSVNLSIYRTMATETPGVIGSKSFTFLKIYKMTGFDTHWRGEGTFLSSKRLVAIWQGNTTSILGGGLDGCVL